MYQMEGDRSNQYSDSQVQRSHGIEGAFSPANIEQDKPDQVQTPKIEDNQFQCKQCTFINTVQNMRDRQQAYCEICGEVDDETYKMLTENIRK